MVLANIMVFITFVGLNDRCRSVLVTFRMDKNSLQGKMLWLF